MSEVVELNGFFIKPYREINRVFVHCSASDNPAHDNVETVKDWHVNGNGWSDIGYHYFIDKEGIVYSGRPVNITPAAQRHHNAGTLAICLSGLNKFTNEQFQSLRILCNDINKAYNRSVTFHGHCEVSNKSCPVFDYKSVLSLDEMGYITEKENIMSDTTSTPVKSGAKTSEFWLTLSTTIVTFVVTILNQVFEWGLSPESILSAITPVLVYILGRSGVKALSK